MPAKSKAQLRLMQAVAHSPQFAAKVNIPQSVGREFTQTTTSDKKAKFKKIASALKRGS